MNSDNATETKKCKYCLSDIPRKAKVCPHCRRSQNRILKWLVAIAVIVIILFSCGDNEDNSVNKIEESQQVSSEPVAATPEPVAEESSVEVSQPEVEIDNTFVVGDIIETSDYIIKFLSAAEHDFKDEFLSPKDGYVFYRVEFEFENISNTDQFVSSIDFYCYADSYSVDEYIWGDDLLSATLSTGKKTKGAIYYEIPEDAEEIVLEYETNFWTEDKIIFIVK